MYIFFFFFLLLASCFIDTSYITCFPDVYAKECFDRIWHCENFKYRDDLVTYIQQLSTLLIKLQHNLHSNLTNNINCYYYNFCTKWVLADSPLYHISNIYKQKLELSISYLLIQKSCPKKRTIINGWVDFHFFNYCLIHLFVGLIFI